MTYAQVRLYKVNELDKEAKRFAINKHKEFLISIFEPFDSGYKTLTEYKKGLNNAYILEEIEINDYLYSADGELLSTVFYTGKHPRAGEHVLTFHGSEYKIIKD